MADKSSEYELSDDDDCNGVDDNEGVKRNHDYDDVDVSNPHHRYADDKDDDDSNPWYPGEVGCVVCGGRVYRVVLMCS